MWNGAVILWGFVYVTLAISKAQRFRIGPLPMVMSRSKHFLGKSLFHVKMHRNITYFIETVGIQSQVECNTFVRGIFFCPRSVCIWLPLMCEFDSYWHFISITFFSRFIFFCHDSKWIILTERCFESPWIA